MTKAIILEMATRYAISTTSTRCSHMGNTECNSCKKADRGECNFRSRREAYLKGFGAALDYAGSAMAKMIE